MAVLMSAIDAGITGWINALSGHSHLLDLLGIAVTQAGVPLLVLAVAAGWWARENRRSERHAIVACGLSFLLGLASNQVVLLFVHRMRPYDAGVTHLLVSPSADPSFPSDHATAAFAIVFGWLFHGRGKKALSFLAGAILVVLSRLYVGTHYASDILGGIATALLAAGVVRMAYREGTHADRWVTGINGIPEFHRMREFVFGRKGPDAPELIHRMFDVVVVLKGLDGVLEIIGGIALLFVQTGVIVALATTLTAHELSEDPHDLLANLLSDWAASFGHGTQMFIAAYLLFHGIAKVTLATFLLMGKSWAYPAALTFFLVFVAYAVSRLWRAWSWSLAGAVVLDLVTIGLVAREWRATIGARHSTRR
jgi:undecaprenyl-diphosphatase